jgi:hypothetical protein
MGPHKLLENELMALECMLTRGVLQKLYTPGSADATLVLDAATEIKEVYYDTRLADYKSKHCPNSAFLNSNSEINPNLVFVEFGNVLVRILLCSNVSF